MGLKLLIIDDNQGDQVLIKEFIEQAGLDYEISVANSGEEGIEKAKEIEPAVVILDTQLPKMDGFDVCKKIKEILQGKTKVIVVTGFVEAVNAQKAREMGADDYCAKTTDCLPLLEALKGIDS